MRIQLTVIDSNLCSVTTDVTNEVVDVYQCKKSWFFQLFLIVVFFSFLIFYTSSLALCPDDEAISVCVRENWAGVPNTSVINPEHSIDLIVFLIATAIKRLYLLVIIDLSKNTSAFSILLYLSTNVLLCFQYYSFGWWLMLQMLLLTFLMLLLLFLMAFFSFFFFFV